MPINPVQFAHNICDEFLRYIYSAYPLSDPDLAQQVHALLKRPSSLDIPLVRGPYVSLSEAFAKGENLADMARAGTIHPVLPELMGYPAMWKHQYDVFTAVRQGQHVLVATGTGSGKTEAFLYPIIDDLLRQRDNGITSGLCALLVYPMNALANDQLERLRGILGGTGITFGQWTGTTPATEGEISIERFSGSARGPYLEARRKRLEEAQANDRAVRPLAPPEECCSEEDIRQRKPRILLTNYRQLEILTTRLPDAGLFAQAPLRYMVFDEAHTYSGATGAEVACLIRRVRALADKTPDEVICIGTSATLSDPQFADHDKAANRFASRFFGVDESQVVNVGESYVSRQWPGSRYKPQPPAGDGTARLERLLKCLAEPVDTAALKPIVQELTGRSFDPGSDWRAALFDHLVSNDYVYHTTEVLKAPKALDEAAWQVSQRVGMDRLPQGPRADAELLAYLTLGAAAAKRGESLLRPKVHFFIRGMDEMVAALADADGETRPELFLSLADAKEKYPGRLDAAFFPVLSCRNCGQHFFEKFYQQLEIQSGPGKGVGGFTNGNAVENADGQSNTVWPAAPVDTGARLVLTTRLLEEVDNGPTAQSSNAHEAYFCRQCGAMHRESGDRCLADGCGHDEPLLALKTFGQRLTSCPSCKSLAFNIGGRPIEPARNIRAITVADVHILAQAMINSAPENHKRLIMFADSRQDAAFQAGWMQDHARRIRLRHMMNRIISSSENSMPLDEVTDRLMQEFRKESKLVESLLPELTGEEAVAVFGSNKWVPVHKALRYMVLREFSTGVRRVDCLEAMGLAQVVYDGLSESDPAVRDWAQVMGILPLEAVEAISLLLDNWRRGRIMCVARDPIFSRYHAKDDPYIQTGLLPLREFRPEGLLLNAEADAKYARGLIARRGASAVQALLKKWAARPDQLDTDAAITMLWDFLTGPRKLLTKVTLRSQRDQPLEDVWQVNSELVRVQKSFIRERCAICQRITTRKGPSSVCMRHHCRGRTNTQQPDMDNYDVWMMGQPFVMVNAEEHTAQVPGEVRAKIEQDFRSSRGQTNCIVATPTLELGVNIGALDMVLMRNVPPRAANYWQRAGRAGREDRMAVVVTYCRRSPHDRYFFDDPLRLLTGAIEAPAFNLQNPLMVAKHVHSAMISELLLHPGRSGENGEEVKEILRQVLPTFIRDYVLDEDDRFRQTSTSVTRFEELLIKMAGPLADRLATLFARHWPAEAATLVDRASLERIVLETPRALAVAIHRLHRRLQWAVETRSRLHGQKDRGLIEKEDEQLLRRCDEFIQKITRRDHSTYTLSVLANEGFLPGYGTYDGGIVAAARKGFAQYAGPRTFELSRSSVVALREFVPGNRLYANRGSFYVARYHLGADEQAQVRSLLVNADKGYVADAGGGTGYGQSSGIPLEALPLADLDLAHESRITEDEVLRFAMPVSVLGRLRKHNRGGFGYKIGEQQISHLHGQNIELVNIGEAGRVGRGELGYLICSVCGAAMTPYASPDVVTRFIHYHKEKCGREPGNFALTAQADVDMLQFHGVADAASAINIGEALRTAATRLLDMGPEDLQLLLLPQPDETLDLLILDPMPGGSGLLEQMLSRWDELIAAARTLLSHCPQGCETACYCCLKTFRNQFHHSLLNRRQGLELIDALATAPERCQEIVPHFEEAQTGGGSPSNRPEAHLESLLSKHHFPAGHCRKRVTTSIGVATEPDWLYEPAKVAVYLDGMSRHLHGDPKTAQRDKIIREAMEMDGFTVIVLQAHDLHDPAIMIQHLKNIARAIGMADLV
jgi:ATP-dependent helicase YprA (DUF1998 family)